ncbi:MAG: hypothetical protein CMO55_14425 [Verrucomicrobiales bacterium]|nr:hypothetical protein [Verrucomicrobiales bacterium]
MKTDVRPPLPISIVGGVLIFAGVGSLVAMILSAILGDFRFDIAFVMIFVGHGILIGRPSSRKWGLVWATLAALAFLGIEVMAIISFVTHDESAKRFTEDDPYAYGIVASVVFAFCLGLSIYGLVVLLREKYKDWFAGEPRPPEVAKCIAIPVAIAAILSTSTTRMLQHEIGRKMQRAWFLSTEIVPIDAETNKPLEKISWSHPQPETVGDAKFSITTSPGESDRHSMRYEGIAFYPREVTLTKEGYEDTTVTLDPSSEDVIRVAMEKIHGETSKNATTPQ